MPTLKACLRLPDLQCAPPSEVAFLLPPPLLQTEVMAPLRIPSHWRGMLGTLLTGRLCISIIQTLFPLGGDWELLEGRSL